MQADGAWAETMMAKGRMIRRELAGSEKFFGISDRAKWVYQLGLAFADRDGFLPGTGRELATMFLGGLIGSWEEIDSLVSEIVSCGLWAAFSDADGRSCAYVAKFADHQDLRDYARESISIYTLPLSGDRAPPTLRDDRDTQVRPGGRNVTRAGLPRPTPGADTRSGDPGPTPGAGTPAGDPVPGPAPEEKRREEKRTEVEVEVEVPPHDDNGDGPDRSRREPRDETEALADRLLKSWTNVWKRVNKNSDRPLPQPRLTIHDAQRLARDIPALEFFKTEDILTLELRRICRIFDANDWAMRRSEPIIEKVGQVFEDAHPDDQEPVTWPKREDHSGDTIAPNVAEALGLGEIGREMPDA